jgi:hypothetical protein
MYEKHTIFGVHITERLQHASQVQACLTEYGHCINTRLGLHEIEKGKDSPNGLLLLEMVGDEKEINEFGKKISQIEGVELQKMVFDHP